MLIRSPADRSSVESADGRSLRFRPLAPRDFVMSRASDARRVCGRMWVRCALVAIAMGVSAASLAAQRRQAIVCNPGNRCFSVDTSVIGGRRFEDYRVTNGSLQSVAQRRALLQ